MTSTLTCAAWLTYHVCTCIVPTTYTKVPIHFPSSTSLQESAPGYVEPVPPTYAPNSTGMFWLLPIHPTSRRPQKHINVPLYILTYPVLFYVPFLLSTWLGWSMASRLFISVYRAKYVLLKSWFSLNSTGVISIKQIVIYASLTCDFLYSYL